jgi:fumarate reductase flavoprotein subunit
VHLANAVARLTDPLSATLVVDDAVWNGPGTSPLIPSNPHLPTRGNPAPRAIDSGAGRLDGCSRTGIDGNSGPLQPGRRSGCNRVAFPASAHRQAPALADPEDTVLRPATVRGDYQHDGGHRCRWARCGPQRGSVPISGVFAAGAATGGLEGGPEIGYVGG